MQPTRLQLFVGLLALVGLGIGGAYWYGMQPKAVVTPRTPSQVKAPAPASEPEPLLGKATPQPTTVASKPPQSSANVSKTIASVGELYRRLSSAGEIPEIAQPLRAAKAALAAGQIVEAEKWANQAKAAATSYKSAHIAETYAVMQGDTLWTIAQKQTPVHHGAAWVGLWKANKKVIKDFDRIEVGWSLMIPAKAAQYATPYWKPKASGMELVDLRELPIPGTFQTEEVAVAELPTRIDTPGFAAAALPVPSFGFLPFVQYH